MMTKLHQLADLGQAIWLDYIRRSFITSGELQALIDEGVRGVTSNPTIFEKAIAGSTDYDEDLRRMVTGGAAAANDTPSVEDIYEGLVLEDIGRAADLLRPVYDRTDGIDGYVSLEVSPTLAHDTAGTIAEARRLFAALDRPNVMIKVPATPAGIPAIKTLIGEGINVNVTLIFSLAHYEAVADAYIGGLEQLAAGGGDLSRVSSVASFFISRVDTAVDRALEERVEDMPAQPLQGKIAVANAKVAYARFREILSGRRWRHLAQLGARVQRPLWASTGTKNPLYPDTLYVDSLIGPDTVNTVPPAALNAFLDHGTVAAALGLGRDEAAAQLHDLPLDLDAITQKLQDDGVAAFTKSFDSLMAAIAEKRDQLLAGWRRQTANLGSYQPSVDAALSQMAGDRIVARIWAHDHTVWKPQATEITNRLGWLHAPETMADQVDRLKALTETVHGEGYTHALVLGMGGSSLAPDVFRQTFGSGSGSLESGPSLALAVLDSTDPGAILAYADRLDPSSTLFIVATKSGSTIETISFFKFFYNWVADAVGSERAGEHFVAITDPGSSLIDLADRYRFRSIFLNDPNIGGRYSALSHFGLVPAALAGVDVQRLLDRAGQLAASCESCVARADNWGAGLGTVMGELAIAPAGRDKITFITSPGIASFGDWVEQLIAESTGKEGKGILPVVGERLGPPEVYGDDRLFVYLRLDGDAEAPDAEVKALEDSGQPVVRLHLHDRYDVGGQFFLWEMATAVAGHHLSINPFDQPNVEAAKRQAQAMVAAFAETGALPADEPAPLTATALKDFLSQARPRDYVALQAYVQPTDETTAALQALRVLLRDQHRLATTVGYGPRFLHSTGQLHKGDAGNGLFIQFTADDAREAPIPDEAGSPDSSMAFGVLKMAQALGDKQALLDAGRRVVRFHLGTDVTGELNRLREALA